MGGVFNSVNLNLYHYGGNNPIILVDPDGRESGYVRDKDAVYHNGHAGLYVEKNNGGYAFFEVASLNEENLRKDGPDYQILGGSQSKFPTAGSVAKRERGENPQGNVGVIRRDFDSKENMISFFRDKKYEDRIEFDTNKSQDAAIFKTAMSEGKSFRDYTIPGNHCGTYAEKSLKANGDGIPKANIWHKALFNIPRIDSIKYHQTPNGIGDRLWFLHKGKRVDN
jgi:hypothetical protein